jgi:hypothetical protein
MTNALTTRFLQQTTAPAPDAASSSSSSPSSVIVGVVIGVAALLLATGIAFWLRTKQRKRAHAYSIDNVALEMKPVKRRQGKCS